MALYSNKKYLTCPKCNGDIFCETETFRVEKKDNNNMINYQKYYKEVLGSKLKCINCGEIIDNPL